MKNNMQHGLGKMLIQIIIMLSGMVVMAIKGGGISELSMVILLAVFVQFLLYRDKKHFGSIVRKALGDEILGMLIPAFLLTGVLSKALIGSGLTNAILGVMAELQIRSGMIPLAGFIIVLLLSLACGTSTGAIAAVGALFFDLSLQAGINLNLMSGALISGAVLGNVVCPISDVVIAASLKGNMEVDKLINRNLKMVAFPALLSILFLYLAGSAGSSTITFEAAGTKIPLLMLFVPVLIIVLIRRGWDMIASLLVCTAFAISLDLVLGRTSLTELLSSQGFIVQGILGMSGVIIYSILLFVFVTVLKGENGLALLFGGSEKKNRGLLQARNVLGTMLSAIITGGGSPAVIMFGDIAFNQEEGGQTLREDTCAILSITAACTSALLPYGTAYILCQGFCQQIEGAAITYYQTFSNTVFGIAMLLFEVLWIAGSLFVRKNKKGVCKNYG